MRVCKVINCEIVKNAKKLLKLTLFDGLDERVIVSSIRDDYTPRRTYRKKDYRNCELKAGEVCRCEE